MRQQSNEEDSNEEDNNKEEIKKEERADAQSSSDPARQQRREH